MNKLLLIDGNSILNRAFYGLPDLTTADGRHTNAVLGFLNIVLRVIDDISATHICVAFDLKHKNFRNDIFEEYKGTRKPMPDELREQLPLIKEVLHAMNIATIEKEGYEADDLLGTMSRLYSLLSDIVILSGDRDLLQLATDKIMVKLPKTKDRKTVVLDYFAKDVEAEYGVDPVTFIDMKGLMGDTSDNIPGVPGIGEKTAAKLLGQFGSMDKLYDGIDSLKKSKMKDNLIEYKEQAYMSRLLATIKLDCEVDLSFDELAIRDMYNEDVYKCFCDLEFKSLLNRFADTKKTEAFELDITIIDDYDDFFNLLSDTKKEKYISFASIPDKNGGICGISLTIAERVYIVQQNEFIRVCDIRHVLSEILQNGTRLICNDLKNELYNYEFADGDDIFDCGLGAYLLNPAKSGYEYDELANDFLNTFVEDRKKLIGKELPSCDSCADEDTKKYMAYMSFVPYKAYPVISKNLKQCGMYDLLIDIEIPCLYTLYDMERNGIRVKRDELAAFGVRLKARINELVKDIYELAGEEFNINSTKQLGEILFEKLGLKSGKKTKSGYSTSVEVLEKIKGEHAIIPLILEYRQLTKLNSTYVEGLSAYIGADERIHGRFNQTVTVTGRISSTDPNLQNIPTRLPLGREIRKVFVPEDGYVFLDADYSQIELRVLAHLSKDSALIDAYNMDSDIHAITASQVFEVPLEKVDETLRRRAKAVNFGIVYGISSFGLGQDLDISRKEAEGFMKKYFETYSGVKAFLDKTVELAKKDGYTTTLFGRRRYLPELSSSNFMTRSFGERAAMNSPIQGTAADIIKIAMVNVNRALKKNGLKSRLVLQVHDELIIETKLEEYDKVKEILIDNMMHAASLSVPLIVDVNRGDSWYAAK